MTIREWLKATRYKQQELAAMAGVSSSTICRIAKGNRCPSRALGEKLAAVSGGLITYPGDNDRGKRQAANKQ